MCQALRDAPASSCCSPCGELKGCQVGQVSGCGCPSGVPHLQVLVDPQVKVKPGADELGVASWRGECPSRAAMVEQVSVLQTWKIMPGHCSCPMWIPAACPSPVCPFCADSGRGVLWVGELPDPVAGFAKERGYSWQGGGGGDLCQHLRPLQEPKLPKWDGVEWGCFPAAWAVFLPPPSWQLQS